MRYLNYAYKRTGPVPFKLGRPCDRCGKRFLKTGRYHRVCYPCMEKNFHIGRAKAAAKRKALREGL